MPQSVRSNFPPLPSPPATSQQIQSSNAPYQKKKTVYSSASRHDEKKKTAPNNLPTKGLVNIGSERTQVVHLEQLLQPFVAVDEVVQLRDQFGYVDFGPVGMDKLLVAFAGQRNHHFSQLVQDARHSDVGAVRHQIAYLAALKDSPGLVQHVQLVRRCRRILK